MEGKFPLCHELPTWHWGGERPEHQQGLWSCASLPNAARSTQKERWACFPYILMTHFSIFCSLYRIYYITSKSNIVYFLRQRVKIKRAEKEDKGKQFSCWHFLFAMPILQLCPKLTCWLRKNKKKIKWILPFPGQDRGDRDVWGRFQQSSYQRNSGWLIDPGVHRRQHWGYRYDSFNVILAS